MRHLLILLVPLLAAGCTSPTPLVCYVGPNMRTSMEQLAHRYEQRTGLKVIVESDEVRTLITRLESSPSADIFVTHDPFLAMLIAKGIPIADAWTIASVTPMIAVPKGNPKHIAGLEDLARPGIRVGLTDSANSLSGHIITLMLQKAGIADKVEANVTKRALVGREIANLLVAGDLDACIVWNAVIFGARDKTDAVDIRPEWRPTPGPDAVITTPALGRLELDYVRVTLATLAHSKSPTRARAFAQFVASPEGQALFLQNGFSPANPTRPTLPKQ